MNCLRLVPDFSAEPFPMRVPRPAAGNITATLMTNLRFYRGFLDVWIGHGLRIALPLRPLVFLRAGDGVHPLVVLAENHLARRGLENAGHGDVDGLRNHPL